MERHLFLAYDPPRLTAFGKRGQGERGVGVILLCLLASYYLVVQWHHSAGQFGGDVIAYLAFL